MVPELQHRLFGDNSGRGSYAHVEKSGTQSFTKNTDLQAGRCTIAQSLFAKKLTTNL